MPNIFDYMKWRDLPLKKVEFNEIDNLILSRVSYFPFDELIKDEEKITLKEAYDRYKKIKLAVFTDGFINCFNTYDELKSKLDRTFDMLSKNIFTMWSLEKIYKHHLDNLSRYGSFDDISIIFVLQNNF